MSISADSMLSPVACSIRVHAQFLVASYSFLFSQVAPNMEKSIVATWSEKGVVNIWDTSKHVILLDAPRTGGGASRNKLTGHKEKPLYTFAGHKVQCYYTAHQNRLC